ncbi:MAG: hypothetical protein ACK55Z_17015, partial [bacterium]
RGWSGSNSFQVALGGNIRSAAPRDTNTILYRSLISIMMVISTSLPVRSPESRPEMVSRICCYRFFEERLPKAGKSRPQEGLRCHCRCSFLKHKVVIVHFLR